MVAPQVSNSLSISGSTCLPPARGEQGHPSWLAHSRGICCVSRSRTGELTQLRQPSAVGTIPCHVSTVTVLLRVPLLRALHVHSIVLSTLVLILLVHPGSLTTSCLQNTQGRGVLPHGSHPHVCVFSFKRVEAFIHRFLQPNIINLLEICCPGEGCTQESSGCLSPCSFFAPSLQ